MTLAWQRGVAKSPGNTGKAQCIASPAYDAKFLHVAATATVIGGTTFAGSVRRLDPATGAVLWQTGLPTVSAARRPWTARACSQSEPMAPARRQTPSTR